MHGVYTDWLLVRRLAAELDERLRGARVRDAGRLDDGRFALALRRRGVEAVLCLDPFAPTPLISLEKAELSLTPRGFERALRAALRERKIAGVRSVYRERVIEVDLIARSKFGVADRLTLVCELVPRFGNLILVKDGLVIAAAKEFGARPGSRTIASGAAYEPPPARSSPSTPLLDAQAAERLENGDPMAPPVHVYRDRSAIAQAHLAPLARFAQLEHETTESLLDVLAQWQEQRNRAAGDERAEKRRLSLRRHFEGVERGLRDRLSRIETALAESESRASLRDEGSAIYAGLYALSPDEQGVQKERAAALFARYKKTGTSASHLQRRKEETMQALEAIETLQWELERAEASMLGDFDQPDGDRAAPARRRSFLRHDTPDGSHIYVGRSPLENAELSFRVARPDDLWFHVRGHPGAHVILRRDDRKAAPEIDILAAASLAAWHSKAKNNANVSVDYTERKHVRKRPGAAPGLVTYTNAKTVTVGPIAAPPGSIQVR